MNIPAPIENGSLAAVPMTGTITRLEVFETQPSNVTNVIKGGVGAQNWGVRLAWEMSGPAANSPFLMGTIYQVQLLLEAIGPNPVDLAIPVPPFQVNYGPGVIGVTPGGQQPGLDPNVRVWDFTIPFVAGGMPAVATGLYKLGVVLQLFAPPFPPGTATTIAGFVDGPLVQFTA
jgi:hypothetical protein